MTKEEHIKYWTDSAQNDLDASENLMNSKNYDWALFVGHLCIEKLIKAIYVQNNDNQVPPKIHNLSRLLELSLVQSNEDLYFKLLEINKFNIEARYPKYKQEFYKLCTLEYASENHNKIREVYNWLRQQLKY